MISNILGQLAAGSTGFTTGSAVADGGFDLLGTIVSAVQGVVSNFGS